MSCSNQTSKLAQENEVVNLVGFEIVLRTAQSLPVIHASRAARLPSQVGNSVVLWFWREMNRHLRKRFKMKFFKKMSQKLSKPLSAFASAQGNHEIGVYNMFFNYR